MTTAVSQGPKATAPGERAPIGLGAAAACARALGPDLVAEPPRLP